MNNRHLQELDIRYHNAKVSDSFLKRYNLCKNLSLVTFSIAMLLGMLTSVVASLNSDPKNCSVIADHAGCVLNRPIDIKKKSQGDVYSVEPILVNKHETFNSESQNLQCGFGITNCQTN